jgi:outer membrane receptor protein involved in Fe transport
VAAQSGAPETLETIIVTARFREESGQDIGASIRAFGENDLARLGIDSDAALVRATPSLNVQERGPNRNQMNIRGITNFLSTQDLQPTAIPVGSYLDDVPINTVGGSQIDVRFFDLQRVEVLRGPQGTLFGEGSAAGAVRYFTRDPDLAATGGKIELDTAFADGGDVDSGARGMINVPLVEDKAALRFSGGRYARPGYVDVIGGKDDVNDFEAINARAVLLALPSENLSLRLLASYDDSTVGAFGQVTGDPDDLETSFPLSDNKIEDENQIYSGQVSYDFGAIKATSITSYFTRERRRAIYEPISSLVLSLQTLRLPNPFAAQAFVEDTIENDQFSEELRFVSNLSGPFNFVAGGFYRDFEFEYRDAEVFSDAYLALGLPSRVNSENVEFRTGAAPPDVALINSGEQISLFLDGSYAVTEKVTLSAGVRWHKEDVQVASPAGVTLLPSISPNPIPVPAIDEEVSIDALFPRASVEYRHNPNLLLFAQYSTGGRNGNLNSPSTLSTVELILGPGSSKPFAAYEDDRVTAYEAGFKTTFLDGRGQFNLTAFYNIYEDLQTLVSTRPLGFRLVVNASEASTSGFEAEFSAELNERWSVFAGASYVDAQLEETLQVSQITGEVLPKGFSLPHSPEWTASAGAEYRHPAWGGEVYVGLHGSYIGEFLTTLEGNSPVVGDYALANLAVGYRGDSWSLDLRVDNVFDTIELTTKNYFDDTLMAAINPIPAGVTFDENFITTPRTVIVMLRKEF